MAGYLIKNARIINEGLSFTGNVLINNGLIEKISQDDIMVPRGTEIVDALNKWLLPGIIDDQVHFREPGLTYKADIATESAAAVAGGVTSFMEMPNTRPQTITIDELKKKYDLGAAKSKANYAFYLGATNDNLNEIKKVDPAKTCGIKIFMGSSTGNMLVDDLKSLEGIFAESPVLIATHCEDETTIRKNTQLYREKFGENIPMKMHPLIRSAEACYKSSSLAVELAEKYQSRLHILHISTARELDLFRNDIPSGEKKITSEVCVHHLWFNDTYYDSKGAFIKWNPAVKTEADRTTLFQGLLDNKLDVIATDHAPHTLDEKKNPYLQAPSGGPMVQHSLVAMLEFARKGKISPEQVVRKMCHAPADIYKVKKRGYIREGYFADLVIVDPASEWTIDSSSLLYKCGWSPLEGETMHHRVTHTFVNGLPAFTDGHLNEGIYALPLEFDR
ncbi:MAG TPA: dihydroorotase [Bacteroidales bacterium]|nr:dihydroorotase [Bacteroidales bacterium]